MSNIVSLRRHEQLPDWSPPECAEVALSAIVDLRSMAFEEIRKALFMLDLSIQQTRLLATHLPDHRTQQRLFRQIETIEELLRLARDACWRL